MQWTVTCRDRQGNKAGYFTCGSAASARKTMLRSRNEGLLVQVSPPLPEDLRGPHPAVLRSDEAREQFNRDNNPTLKNWRPGGTR